MLFSCSLRCTHGITDDVKSPVTTPGEKHKTKYKSEPSQLRRCRPCEKVPEHPVWMGVDPDCDLSFSCFLKMTPNRTTPSESMQCDGSKNNTPPHTHTDMDAPELPAAAAGDGHAQDEGGKVESSTADRNGLTMGRGGSMGNVNLLPPPAAAPVTPTPAPPSVAPPEAAPPAPPASRVPVTDPNDALITAQPEMLSCRITPEDEFVLLACDGLFDVFSSDEVGFVEACCWEKGIGEE